VGLRSGQCTHPGAAASRAPPAPLLSAPVLLFVDGVAPWFSQAPPDLRVLLQEFPQHLKGGRFKFLSQTVGGWSAVLVPEVRLCSRMLPLSPVGMS
jgi:hypothetical protein